MSSSMQCWELQQRSNVYHPAWSSQVVHQTTNLMHQLISLHITPGVILTNMKENDVGLVNAKYHPSKTFLCIPVSVQ